MQISLLQGAFGVPIPPGQTAPVPEGEFWLALEGVAADLAPPPEPPPPQGAPIALGAEATPTWPIAEGEAPDPLLLLPQTTGEGEAPLPTLIEEEPLLNDAETEETPTDLTMVAAFAPVAPVMELISAASPDWEPGVPIQVTPPPGVIAAIGPTPQTTVPDAPFVFPTVDQPVAPTRNALPVDARIEAALRPTEVDLQVSAPERRVAVSATTVASTTDAPVETALFERPTQRADAPTARPSLSQPSPMPAQPSLDPIAIPTTTTPTIADPNPNPEPIEELAREIQPDVRYVENPSDELDPNKRPAPEGRSSEPAKPRLAVNVAEPAVAVRPESSSIPAEAIVPESKAEAAVTPAPQSEVARVAETRATVRPAETATPVRAEPVAEQIIATIDALAELRAPSRIRVQLEPEDLGTITVVVKAFGTRFEADIAASHDGVRHALEQGRAGLAQAVESRGLQLGQLTLTGGESGFGQGRSGQSSDQQQAHQEFQRAVAAHQSLAGSRSESQPRTAPAPITHRGALDYTI